MEIIRSQDKKRIINISTCNLIAIVGTQGKLNNITADGMVIGTYSTEEKAIKVLDMIQERYQAIWEEENCLRCGGEHISSVFHMPQDSEV